MPIVTGRRKDGTKRRILRDADEREAGPARWEVGKCSRGDLLRLLHHVGALRPWRSPLAFCEAPLLDHASGRCWTGAKGDRFGYVWMEYQDYRRDVQGRLP